MILPRSIALVLLLSALAALPAVAQEQPAPPSPPAPAPAATPGQQPVQLREVPTLDIAQALTRARDAYRHAPIAERIALHLIWPDGHERTSTILLCLDHASSVDPAAPPARRLRLSLGAYEVAADDHTLTVISTQDAATYYQVTLPDGLTPLSLRGVLPPIPLPQVDWAFDNSPTPPDPARALASLGIAPVTWSDQVLFTRRAEAIYSGSFKDAPVRLTFDSATARVTHLETPTAPIPGPRLVATITPQDLPTPEQWAIPLAGRRQVPSLAELHTRAETDLALHLPSLSLMTRDLEPWSLADELAKRPDGPAAPNRDVVALLIMFRNQAAAPRADALAAVRVVATLRASLAIRYPEAEHRPRVLSALIPMLELPEFNRARLAEIDDQLAAALAQTPNAPIRLFSPTGAAMVDHLSKGASALILVVDPDQNILATLPLDARAPDTIGLARDAEAAITDPARPHP